MATHLCFFTTQASALSQNGYGLIQHKTFSGSPLQGHARGYAGVKNSPVSRPHLAFSLSLKQQARTLGLERRFREASLHLSPLLTANTLVRALGPHFLPTLAIIIITIIITLCT